MIAGVIAQQGVIPAAGNPPADFMNPAPTAVYSLRKLNPAYSGPCLKVRRSSDDTTQDVGFSGGVLDTSALLAFVGSGNGFVDTWYDQSGNANHAAQAALNQQPRIVSAGVVDSTNGKTALWFNASNQSGTGFDDSNDLILTPPFKFMDSAQTILFAAVLRSSVSGYYPAPLSQQFSDRWGMGFNVLGDPDGQTMGSGDDPSWDPVARNNYGNWFVSAWFGPGRMTSTGWIPYTTTYNGSDGCRTLTSGFGSTAAGATRIGGKNFRGWMRELIVYPSELSTATRKSFEGDMCAEIGATMRRPYFTPTLPYGLTSGVEQVVSVRKLVPEYNGPCMTINRNDGALAEIGFDSSGLLDVAAIAAFVGSGSGSCAIWHDQLGEGKGWIVRNSSDGPWVREFGVNVTLDTGLPAVRITTARRLDSGYSPIGGAWTMLTVTMPSGTGYRSLYSLALSSNAMSFGLQSGTNYFDMMGNGFTDTANGVAIPLDTKHVLSFRASAGYSSGSYTTTPAMNGVDRATLTVNYSTRTPRLNYSRMGISTSTVDDYTGHVSEFLVCSKQLDTSEMNAVENSMGAYYGITIT